MPLRSMSDRIRTLLLEANGTHWAAICVDTIGQGAFTKRGSGSTWINQSRVLRKLFGDRYADASYMADWRDAFYADPRLAVETCNITNLVEYARHRPHIRDYDLIVVLHSAAGDRMEILGHTASWFQKRRGKLAMFVGNEYDLMEQKIGFAKAAGADYICTQLPVETARQLYVGSGEVVAMPHALNPAVYNPQQLKRTIDIGFVGDLYERLIGDSERTDIVQFFRKHGADHGLRCDIRAERMPRQTWSAFLNSCHGIIGAESGTYYLQPDGRALNCAKGYVKQHPDSSFAEVFGECFAQAGPSLNGKAISSRHFEPIGTKTCQLLIEGSFNGILEPDVHYIAVRRDLSNIEDAIRRFKDEECRARIVNAAYSHVLNQHTYVHRIRHLVDIALGERLPVPAASVN